MIKKFDKILIANRGEIAIRIIRTAKSMGIKTVALYTLSEENAAYVKDADEAVSFGIASLNESYLNINKIVEIAFQTGAQAIHPGYGFLSENAEFAKACHENGIVFIGPSVEVLQKTGNKVVAKIIAEKAGIKVLASFVIDQNALESQASQFNYPMLIKASHGGGGKGMQIVHCYDELIEKIKLAKRAAQNYFANGEIFLEEYIENARHIEVQILADKHGNIIHLYERDCTVQRNYQKIIEEAPATCLSAVLRKEIHKAAIAICNEVGYVNAGTVEFLLDNNQFYFLEINPRIQVEHPVTEQVCGIDIVKEQLQVAAGNSLSFLQDEVKLKGHAIELRIYAEDTAKDYVPSAMPVNYYSFPKLEGIRIETGISSVSSENDQYDPLLCKVIATGVDREHAILQVLNALNACVISGPKTNQLYLKEILKTVSFQKNNLNTKFCELNHKALVDKISIIKENFDLRFLIAASLYSFYNLTPVRSDSVWNSVAYWRMYSIVEISIDKKYYSVSFDKKSNGLQIRGADVSFSATLKRKSNESNEIEIQIGKELKAFSTVKKNDAKIELIHQGIVYELCAIDNIDYYPENYVIDFDSNLDDINLVKSHLHGKIVAVNVEKNQTINKGDVMLVIDSMKSENSVKSPKKARIKKITVELGTQVTDQMPLVYLEDL